MLPPHIINKKIDEQPAQIQLEIPDYSAEYSEWIRKKEQEHDEKTSETVIVIDIY